MGSSSYPGYIVYGLAILSFAGWGLAWKNSRALDVERAVAATLQKTQSKTGSRESRDASVANTIHNPRSARLFTELTKISAEARPGVVNQALIDACRTTLLDNDPETRRRDFSLLMEQLRPEDAAAMHRAFLALHREGRPFGEYSCFAARWGEIDGKGAMDYLFSEKPFVFPARDFEVITRGWATRDPEGALAWLSAHPDEAESLGGKAPFVEGWMRRDPDAATKWLLQQQLPPGEIVDSIAGGYHEQLRGPGPDKAIEWLANLPDSDIYGVAASQGWNRSMYDLCELPYADAAKAWSQVGDKSWMSVEQFAAFSNMVSQSRSADNGLQGFLDELPQHWPAEKIEARFMEWAQNDPGQTTQWIQNAPPSAVRTAAIQGMIRSTEKTDPAAAQTWRAMLEK